MYTEHRNPEHGVSRGAEAKSRGVSGRRRKACLWAGAKGVPVWILAFLATGAIAATNMTPVAVTGFNRDVVVENTALGPPYTNEAMEFNLGEGRAYYQRGLAGQAYGLPVSGRFTNATDGAVFQFQSYTAANVLVLYSNSPGTLILTAPATYSRIAVIANSGSGTATGAATVTLNFSDGSAFVTNYYAPDWFNNTYNVALGGVDRIRLTTGVVDGGSGGNPRFYQTTLPLFTLGASNKPLVSLTFGMPASTRSTGIYAISGLRNSDVSPPAVSNAPATGVLALSATLNGQVTDVGGETPSVTLFYGPADGGTVPEDWSNSVALGDVEGAFSQSVLSLAPNTVYYFSAEAVNSGGAAWAAPVGTFTTLQLAVPVVANLPASGIQGTGATLNGEVLDTGGSPPDVTLYYGPIDGGTNASAWSNNIVLGVQDGVFAETVSGLVPGTTYYFASEVVNDAGAGWGVPSRSFTTAETNTPWPFVAVLTQHNDNNRSGDNLDETALNVFNVNTNQFGLLYARPVDDQIYAQPLVMTNVSILGKGSRNIVIVATVNDTVYAFDADDPSVTEPYWMDSFIDPPDIVPPRNTDMTGACGGNYKDFSGNIGIVGTPVIDPASGTVYLVARTKEIFGAATNYVQRLQALDVATGAERSNSPVVIAATCAGTGAGSAGGVLTFDPQKGNQRAGLTLANGIVYITWSSHCDWGPYHGWVVGYDASTLQQVSVYNDTPNGSDGGIWMSAQAPAADSEGNLYLVTGNGTVDTITNGDYGESFLKLAPSNGTMTVASWFTPYNWAALNAHDTDLGCAGLLLIPGTTLAISGGKQGVLYLVNRDDMGGLSEANADTNIVQSWSLNSSQIHGGPVWWSCPEGSFAYIWPQATNHLRQYRFVGGLFDTTPYAVAPTVGGAGSPGGTLSLSANGTNAGTGILWATVNTTANANQATVAGTLHAYNAQNVAVELWNSDMVPRDAVGNLAKFVPPTVANGKVYLATFSDRLNVYGLLPPPALGIALSGGNAELFWPTNTPVGWTVQTSTNLATGGWIDVTNPVANTNGRFQVTLPQTNAPAVFYRLKW